jgi:hypothetical protein
MTRVLIIVLLALLPLVAYPQKGQSYWTKTVLATESTCKLRIGDGVFSPMEKECSYSGHLRANSKLFVRSVKYSGPWAKLELVEEDGSIFHLEITNKSKAIFKKVFGEFFSRKASDKYEPTCNGKKMNDFVRAVGFPDLLNRTGALERWTLSYTHYSVQSCGFDTATLEFKNGKLETLHGSI